MLRLMHRHGNKDSTMDGLRATTNKHLSKIPAFQPFFAVFSLFIILLLAPEAAMANPKYAAIVVDADTETVLHEAYADATRHPASLTKMMTLYMTFEALEKGRLRLYQKLPVSSRAASMPQTNIGLRRGERISVKDAIRALVVRSANDVAVVLAEAMGKTEWQFAVSMTNRARRLGLKNTVFRNASGLPDRRQISTARDMAKLGLHLRQDFPQYYHYFKETSFRWNGRTYNGHNNVLKDVQGVDGLKTGYINMSGFNLVTSIKRNGYSLVAVVLGGRTSRSRDAHMKDLLQRSLRQIAQMRPPLGDKLFAKGSEPVPVFKPGTEPVISTSDIPQPAIKPASAGDVAYAPSAGRVAGSTQQGWGIQVGAFSESRDAFMAAVHAMNLAAGELDGSEISVLDPSGSEGRVYRARIANMTETQARRACRILISRRESCFVYRDRNG